MTPEEARAELARRSGNTQNADSGISKDAAIAELERRRSSDQPAAEEVETAPSVDKETYVNPFYQQYGVPATKDSPIGIPEFVTGQARGRYDIEREGLPELVSTNPGFIEGMKIVGTTLAESNPEKRAEMLGQLGFDIRKENGIDYVYKDDERIAVVNKPGLSRTDLLELGSTIAKYAPAARITAMGRALLGKVGLGAATAGLTSSIEEKAQESLGGEFSGEDVVIASALGAGGEILAKAAGSFLNRVAPAIRNKFFQAKTAEDLKKLGMTSDEVAEMAENIKRSSAEASELGVTQPMPAESIGRNPAGAAVQADVRETAKTSIPRASQIEESVTSRTGELRDAFNRSFGRFPEVSAADATKRARGVAEEVIGAEKATRRGLSDIAYSKAWDGADVIDPDPIIKNIIELSEKQRIPSVKQALRSRARMLDSENGITAEEAQQVVWDIRDDLAVPQGQPKSVKSQLRGLLKDVEKDLVGAINKATSGKYSQADSLYKKLSSNLNELIDSKIGVAAGKKDIGLDSVLDSIFNPKPVNRSLSKEFMGRLSRQNPDAAADLYQAYFVSKMDSIPTDAKPSEIVKAIYGSGESAQNMVATLAPDKKTADRLMKIKRQLETVSTFEGVNMDVAATAETQKKLEKGLANIVGKIFTPGFSARHGLEDMTVGRQSRILFEAAVNAKWANQLDDISKLIAKDEASGELAWAGLIKEIQNTLTDPSAIEPAARASIQSTKE